MLLLECIQTRTQGLLSFHQGFQHQHRREQGVPLGQVHAEAHTTGFLSADQHIPGQHLCGDVLEAHRELQNLASLGLRHQPHQIRAAHGLDHGARQLAGSGQVIDQQGHQQLGAAEPAGFIHGSDAVTIAVEHQSHRRSSGGR